MDSRPVRLLPALLVLCLLPGVASAQQRYAVQGGPVTLSRMPTSPRAPLFVQGSFVLAPDPAGIETNNRGGACLVADMRAQHLGGLACDTDSECNGPLVMRQVHSKNAGPAEQLSRQDWEGYCLPEQDIPSSRGLAGARHAGICWIRPGGQGELCNINKPPQATLVPGRTYYTPNARALPAGFTGPIRWRVHTCLNPRVTGTPPCSIRDATGKLSLNGPVLAIPH